MLDSDLISALKTSAEDLTQSTEADLRDLEALYGFRLPPSYRTFCQELGFGLLGGIVYLEPPLNVTYAGSGQPFRGLLESGPFQNAELGRFVRESEASGLTLGDGFLDQGAFVPEAGLIDALRYFGRSDIGHLFFWDSRQATPGAARELPIYGMLEYEEIYPIADDLGGFLQRLFAPDNSGVFGEAQDPLPQEFQTGQGTFAP